MYRVKKEPLRGILLAVGICAAEFLITALYLFVYTGWDGITGADAVRFVTSGLLGYALMGCVFQLLKEKSGTIWLPVLLHGLMDFSIVLKY